jgi:peptide/nickel transport system ATP-binding protein
MAMACSPDLLVLDEPTTALDVTTQVDVLMTIKAAIRGRGTAAVYVSHDLAVVAQIADSIIVMRNGYIIEQGSTARILVQPQQEYTRLLLTAVRPMPAVAAVPDGIADSATAYRASDMLRATSITAGFFRPRWFGNIPEHHQILRKVDLAVGAGEVVGLVGESGSGKSTLARVICGLHAPWSGEVRLAGSLLGRTAAERSLEQARRIQMVFQSPDLSLNPEHRVDEEVGRPLDLYFDLSPSAKRDRIRELLAMVGLDSSHATRFPGELSGGQKQRVSLARAFAAQPDILLCDEILSALDTVVATSILQLLRSLRSRLSIAFLFISHDLATVASIADRVVVLYAGKVCQQGPAHSVFARPHHPYTAMLLASVPEVRQGWLEQAEKWRKPSAQIGGTQVPRDSGCSFRSRCPMRIEGLCEQVPPPPRMVGASNVIYCHRDLADLSAPTALGAG